MENVIDQMRQDFVDLIDEHEIAAKNNHLWALGSNDPDDALEYEIQADQHRALADMYRRMLTRVSCFAVACGG